MISNIVLLLVLTSVENDPIVHVSRPDAGNPSTTTVYDELLALGANDVQLDRTQLNRPVISADLNTCEITDKMLAKLIPKIKRIRFLSLGGNNITDAGLQNVHQLGSAK